VRVHASAAAAVARFAVSAAMAAALALGGPALAADAGAGVTVPKFDITVFRIEGNTVLPARDAEEAVKPYVGKQRDFGDVQRALEALQLLFQKRGYGTVQVYLPEQRLESGVITLRVIEATVGKVTVTGNRYFSAENTRRALPDLREGTVPNVVEIAENTRAANENPARQLQVVLKPGTAEREVDADVEVRDQPPIRPFLSFDNTGTESTGRYRAGIGIQHANLWNRDHVATIQYITSPTETKDVSIYSLGYRFPIPTWGDSVDLYAGYSDVAAAQTQTPAGPLAFSGKGTVAGGRYNFILRRRGEYEHRVLFGLDYRRFDNLCSLGVFGSAGCVSTTGSLSGKTEYRPVSLGYSGAWNQPSRQLAFNATAVRNIPGSGDASQDAFTAARTGAVADYRILRYAVQYMTAMFGSDWQMRAALAGQQTNDALLPAEQLGVAGFNTVRGFNEREVLGDRGYYANFEFYTPDIGRALVSPQFNFRMLAFYDRGLAQINDPVPGQIEKEIVASTGIGLRSALSRYLTLRLDAARVLDAGGSRQRGDTMVQFGLVASY